MQIQTECDLNGNNYPLTGLHLQTCLGFSCHGFIKVLETFPRHFGPCCHGSVTELLPACLHVSEVIYWIERWLLTVEAVGVQ